MDMFDQAFGPPNGGFDDRWAVSQHARAHTHTAHTTDATVHSYLTRDLQIESLKRDLELLRAELERVKREVNQKQQTAQTVKGNNMYVQRNLDDVWQMECRTFTLNESRVSPALEGMEHRQILAGFSGGALNLATYEKSERK